MSLLERRLQLLLDEERYALVRAESQRSGRSIAAVIREAIDDRFAVREQDARTAAAARLLERHADPGAGHEPDWDAIKGELEDDLLRPLRAAT
ncbi:hypothetical protein [Lapillicoccus sp.]|uniref:hypothetical protein n=1 Tax=Lapillicoccus sp. TaxID=1909287 RepID=UPI0025CD8526|nr:hypothetical protein [Lapillicoccus sp.]